MLTVITCSVQHYSARTTNRIKWTPMEVATAVCQTHLL